MKRQERAFGQLPLPLFMLFLLGFALLVTTHALDRDRLHRAFVQIESPQAPEYYRSASLGSVKLMSYLMLLNLQLHDNQAGTHVSYRKLDYTRLSQWLETAFELNPSSAYPAFLASRVYTNVADPARIDLMIELIEQLFQQDPQLHWRRMTEASLLAKHRLGDLQRALQLAEQIAQLPENIRMPYWARDMRIILLDELGELESARILISSLLESQQIEDPDEVRFLQQRLLKIQRSLSSNGQIPE